jgi:hypothetical protein
LPPCDPVATTFEFHAYLTLVVFTCPWAVSHRSNLAEDWEQEVASEMKKSEFITQRGLQGATT